MATRILLVDDQPRNLLALEALLEPLGYELIRATDGWSAIAAFEGQRPDLVLLDFMMPGMNGIEVLKHIRAHEEKSHVPVVLVTAHTDREFRIEGLEAGADEFLEKPIDAPVLRARVRTLLAFKASRDELALRHEALLQAQRENRELTEFIVHDLRNPLAVVCAGLDCTQEGLDDSHAELKEVIAEARQAAARLRAMIGDLLTISCMEAGNFPMKCEPLVLSKLLQSVAAPYQRPAGERRITLVTPPEQSIVLEGDPTLLRRVVENLLDNALRYTPPSGRIAIGLKPRREVEISVSNDGVPIPASERQHVFDKFRRGPDEGGTLGNAGLGLYFCKRAVEAHGGAIDVTQTSDWATSFVIRLPLPHIALS